MVFLVNPFGSFGGAPTDPDFASVILLAPFESPSFVDLSPSPGTLTGGGGASIDTTRYAAGALLLNGTSSGSRVSFNKNCQVGTGQFTLEAYVRPTAAQTGRVFSAQDTNFPNAVLALRVDSGGSITSILRNSGGTGTQVLTSSTGLVAMNDTTLHHIAMTRDGSNSVNIWHNGTSVASGSSSTDPNAGRAYFIGAQDNTQERFAGIIRWARITEGVCRYTGTFTPPSMPYPTS
jgi:hypothetical protein